MRIHIYHTPRGQPFMRNTTRKKQFDDVQLYGTTVRCTTVQHENKKHKTL